MPSEPAQKAPLQTDEKHTRVLDRGDSGDVGDLTLLLRKRTKAHKMAMISSAYLKQTATQHLIWNGQQTTRAIR
jgi:hypothetical protein